MALLPLPNIIGQTTEEQIREIKSYLIQLQEELEFQLQALEDKLGGQ